MAKFVFLSTYIYSSSCNLVLNFLNMFQIRKMDLEARTLQASVKATLVAKLREYKNDVNKLKTEVKRITSSGSAINAFNQAARDEWLDSGLPDEMVVITNFEHHICVFVFVFV